MDLRQEKLVISSLIVLFIISGFLFGAKIKSVWLDEVALTEPASNIYFHGSFTSSVWYHQSNKAFHVGTSPLYEFFILIWMKIFGFSLLKIRLLNYVLMIFSSIILWLAIKKIGIIRSPFLRVLLISSFLMLNGISFSYTSGRYDTVCILLLTIGLYLFSDKNAKRRVILIAIIGFFSPLASLSFLVYCILIFISISIFKYSLIWKEFIAFVIGVLFGILFLFLIYSNNGVWNDYTSMSYGYSSIAKNPDINYINEIIIEKIIRLFDKNDYICNGCLTSSWPEMIIILIFIIFYEILNKTFKLHSYSIFGVFVALIIPLCLCLVTKFPIYYSWMCLIPMLICIFHSVDRLIQHKSFKRQRKITFYLIIGLLFLIGNYSGLPSSIRHTFQERDMNYDTMIRFIGNNVNKTEVIYADFSTFYAIKGKNNKIFFPLHYSQMTNKDFNELTTIIIDPRETVRADWNPSISTLLKNRSSLWYDTGITFDNEVYCLKIYRKKTNHSNSKFS